MVSEGSMADRWYEGTQGSLFDQPDPQRIELQDGELLLLPGWLDESEVRGLLHSLMNRVPWEQSVIQLYGRPVQIPRLNAWFGDPGCGYAYSGHRLPLHPWLPELSTLRGRLHRELNVDSNSVLVNLYRDGQDSVAWHSDDEPELGRNPVIAAVSLGAERRFSLRHRHNKSLETLHLQLPSGSLLLMSGATQHHWYHCLPKSARVNAPRISLTFRQVQMSGRRKGT